jgi:subtilisin family serine protease
VKKEITLLFSVFIAGILFGQQKSIDEFDSEFLNWYNKDLVENKVMGTSVDKTYNELLQDLTPKKTIIVAVIDGGVDIYHKELEGKIWSNPNEIPNNGIDDDDNGYIDDIHGWNFIGNAKGENVLLENLEYTRIVKYNDKSDKDYPVALAKHRKEVKKRKTQKENYESFKKNWEAAHSVIKENTGITVESKKDALKVRPQDQTVLRSKNFLVSKYGQGVTSAMLEGLLTSNSEYLDFYLNTAFNARELVGDDPLNITDKFYGNNNVKGPNSDHGTSVAGVIAAIRDNGIGINGIASNVKIMTVRSTPNGDERDKDVALAIRYAVDNGADIINMSFGKDFSPQKEFVDAAVKHAEEQGVLMVHSSGNDGQDVDVNEKFPSKLYLDKTEPTNWLSVGATQLDLNKSICGAFSNYGVNQVDIFSPGVEVISLDSNNSYAQTSGTSIAAPILSGIAALVLSYYPDLTPQDLITILTESSYKVAKPRKVFVPSLSDEKKKKAKFSAISRSGGIVNAYNAFKYIEVNAINSKQ